MENNLAAEGNKLERPSYDDQVKPKPERIHLKHSGSFYKDLSNKSFNSMAWICFIWQA